MTIENKFSLPAFVALARRLASDTSDVEVKTAAAGLPKDIVDTISAFANKSGGVIICGLSEKNGFTPAEGFNAKKIADALAQACCDKMEPPVRADIEIADFEDSLVTIAKIPETPPYLKPCYVKARSLYEGSYIRTGEGDRKLNRYEVDRLLEGHHQPTFDTQPVNAASANDLDRELIDGFLRRERAMSPRIFAGLNDEDALLTTGVIALDEDGTLKPTLAGLLALGRHPQRYFPRANVTFASFPGTSKEELATSGARFLDSRTIDGPIPVMVAETLQCIRRNMKTVSYITGEGRTDRPEYPEIAIREAVANALMHRDYSPEALGSQVQVNMFIDRIEILSPGGLFGIVTVDNIGQYGASSSRNQRLSRILESAPYPQGYPEFGFVVENKGTGFAQIQAALKNCSMPPAEPKDNLALFSLTMRKASESAMMQTSAETTEVATDRNRIVDFIEKNGMVSSSEAAQLLGVSRATALRKLKELVAEGIIKPTANIGRSVKYVL